MPSPSACILLRLFQPSGFPFPAARLCKRSTHWLPAFPQAPRKGEAKKARQERHAEKENPFVTRMGSVRENTAGSPAEPIRTLPKNPLRPSSYGPQTGKSRRGISSSSPNLTRPPRIASVPAHSLLPVHGHRAEHHYVTETKSLRYIHRIQLP